MINYTDLLTFLVLNLQLPVETDHLDLSKNSITFLPDGSFSSVATLRTLDLSGNSLSDIQINAFQNLQSLQTLNLSRNELQGEITLHLSRHSN